MRRPLRLKRARDRGAGRRANKASSIVSVSRVAGAYEVRHGALERGYFHRSQCRRVGEARFDEASRQKWQKSTSARGRRRCVGGGVGPDAGADAECASGAVLKSSLFVALDLIFCHVLECGALASKICGQVLFRRGVTFFQPPLIAVFS